MICIHQVRDLTHDGCHDLQRVAPFYRDMCHCSQRVAPFYLETLTTTTTDQTTGLLVRSDRLVLGMR